MYVLAVKEVAGAVIAVDPASGIILVTGIQAKMRVVGVTVRACVNNVKGRDKSSDEMALKYFILKGAEREG